MLRTMLDNLVFQNVRSFKNRQDFGLDPKQSQPVFRITGDYNSGKSNLVRAFELLQQVVSFPNRDATTPLITDTYNDNEDNTLFDIEFVYQDLCYEYYLEYNADQVIYEALIVDQNTIFSRRKQRITGATRHLRALAMNVRPNELMLYHAQQNNVKDAINVFNWLTTQMQILDLTNLSDKDLERLLNKPELKQEILDILKQLGFQITDLDVFYNKKPVNYGNTDSADLDTGNDSLLLNYLKNNQPKYKLFCNYTVNGQKVARDVNDESTSVKAILVLLINALVSEDRLLLIDNFDHYFGSKRNKILELLEQKSSNHLLMTETSLNNTKSDFSISKNSLGESTISLPF